MTAACPPTLPSIHAAPAAASPWLERFAHLLAPGSEVLDVACGSGRHMRRLAELGHRPLGVDRDAASLAQAAAWGPVLQADLEGAPWPLPGRQFDAVLVTHYLWRPLWPALLGALRPGGWLIYETFSQGHARIGRPSRAEFLLQPGELLQVCQGLRVLAYEEGLCQDPPKVVQRIVACREDTASAPGPWPLVAGARWPAPAGLTPP